MDKKIIITLSVGIIIIGLWFGLFFMPVNKDVRSLKTRMSDLERKEKEVIPNEMLSLTRHEVDTLGSQLAYKIKRIYMQERLLELGKEVENIGKKYGIKLVKITPNFQAISNLLEGKKITSLPVTIEFSGQYRQFTKFLDELNMLSFNIRINEIEIEKSDASRYLLNFKLQGDIALKKREVDKEPVQIVGKTDQA